MKKFVCLAVTSLFVWISVYPEGFAVGTLVKTPSGYQHIQNLKIGDLVSSYNDQDVIVQQPIIGVKVSVVQEHCCVTVDEQKLVTSAEQKFYLIEFGEWVQAQHLIAPVGIECVRSAKILYSISLPEYHEYCVTPLDIRVHNVAPLIGICCTWAFSAAGIEFVGASISFGIAAIAAIFGIKVACDGIVKCEVPAGNKEIASCGQQNIVVSADAVCGTGQVPEAIRDTPVCVLPEHNIPQMSCGKQPEALLPSYSCGQGVEDFPLCLKTEQDREKKREEWRPLTNKEAREKAKDLGYEENNNPPFDPRGKLAFRNGKAWISSDADGNKGGTWKKFDSKGNRIGTYNEDLSKMLGT